MDYTVHGVPKSWTGLRDFHFTYFYYYTTVSFREMGGNRNRESQKWGPGSGRVMRHIYIYIYNFNKYPHESHDVSGVKNLQLKTSLVVQ